ncbi:MAG: c-type cytochrome [Sedimenticola thiotaurini]|uniref:C-type cytochrome n=1 Tax=Sedimenticola thiotaurini TaxID=1543721 RepID=A0A558D6N1_9GAMM|nr:MAG: c-type cytochrome [Sedimenticola thiotaurini]
MSKTLTLTLATSLAIFASPVSSADGEQVFKICQSCHSAKADGEKKFGPNLSGIIGRNCGAVEGYEYSEGYLKACKSSNIKWTEPEIHTYLDNPTKYLKSKGGGRSKMSFMLKKEDERRAVIEYLKTF